MLFNLSLNNFRMVYLAYRTMSFMVYYSLAIAKQIIVTNITTWFLNNLQFNKISVNSLKISNKFTLIPTCSKNPRGQNYRIQGHSFSISLNNNSCYCYLSRSTKDCDQFTSAGPLWPWNSYMLPEVKMTAQRANTKRN